MAPGSGCVVTVGTYDGVHLGHRRLLAEAMREAEARNVPTVVVTFDRHPAEVLRPDRSPRLLTGLAHKLELLQATGVDQVEVLHFDLERAGESAEDFVLGDLIGRLGAAVVLVGSNFRFGHRQRGDIAMLQVLAAEHGFEARGIDLVIDDETHSVVSSSAIRGLLDAGAVGEAARLLGRPHEVRGELEGEVFVLDEALALPAEGNYEALIGTPGGLSVAVDAQIRAGGTVTVTAREDGDLDRRGPLALRFVARLDDNASSAVAHGAAPDTAL